jgi:hypothetical protein
MLRYQRVLQDQNGYAVIPDSIRQANPNDYYLGDQNSLFVRVQYSYKDYLKVGLVGEKDAGEPFLPQSDTLHKGFDFYSVHLFVKNIGIVKQLAHGAFGRAGDGSQSVALHLPQKQPKHHQPPHLQQHGQRLAVVHSHDGTDKFGLDSGGGGDRPKLRPVSIRPGNGG